MSVINKILSRKNRYYKTIHIFNEDDFGKYLLTWHGPPTKYMVGKVIQIRIEAGMFGSDMVLLRHYDNTLMRHENQSYYEIDEIFKKDLDKLFSECDIDSTEITYTIGNGEYPEKGFIIPSKVKDGESTPMRDVKNALANKMFEMLHAKDGGGSNETTTD